MKFLVLICLVVIGYANGISDDEVLKKWEIYKEQFGKTFRSPIESRKRLAIFKDNLQKIEEHNALYEQGKSTYTEGINQFTDWTSEEFLKYVNKGLIDKPVLRGEIFNKTGDIEVTNVYHFDWRDANVVTDVKNQGSCGASWAFSATGAIEGQLGMQGRLTSLSEQGLLDCTRTFGNNKCEGGYTTNCYEYIARYGIESEETRPYTGKESVCGGTGEIVTRMVAYAIVPKGSDNALQTALVRKGPISAVICATENLQRYSGGIFDDPSCNSVELNHSVLVVGFGLDSLPYYIVKNSWGASWGEGGYFRLLQTGSGNFCGIASSATFPIL